MSVEALYPKVMPSVPGCPESQVSNAILEAARELCRRSEVWAEKADAISLIKSKDTYTFSGLPDYGRVLSVRTLKYNGRDLENLVDRDLDASDPGWQGRTGKPLGYIHQGGSQSLRVVPIPKESEARAITHLWVAMQPTTTATVLPDILLNDYDEAIAQGALYRLMMQPNVSWRDPQMAQVYARQFGSRVNDAKIQAQRGWGDAPLRVQPRRFV